MALLGLAHGALNLVCAAHNPLLWPSMSLAAQPRRLHMFFFCHPLS